MNKEAKVTTENSIKPETNNGYLFGIIGSILGGLVASLPWIIMYVYVEMMWSFMAFLIGYGAFLGYKLFKGKMDIKVPYIIGIVSIIVIIFTTLYVIPALLIIKEGLTPSFEILSLLYSNTEFKSAIIKDLIFAVLFTVLGVSGIFKTLKNQAKNGEELTLKKTSKEENVSKEESKEEK
ncbi:MAG: hypothetical protein MSH48_03320 [Mollicutes bacterium]|nr:hypothetical protein [Mollicutes bacterium]